MKLCLNCKLQLSKEFFYKDARNKDGLRSWCKQCLNKYHAKYQNPKYRKQYYDRIKSYGIGTRAIGYLGLKLALFVYDRAGRKCEMCLSEYDLTVDHIDGQGRNYQNQGLPMNNHPDNLRILCRKCHGRVSANTRWAKRNQKRN